MIKIIIWCVIQFFFRATPDAYDEWPNNFYILLCQFGFPVFYVIVASKLIYDKNTKAIKQTCGCLPTLIQVIDWNSALYVAKLNIDVSSILSRLLLYLIVSRSKDLSPKNSSCSIIENPEVVQNDSSPNEVSDGLARSRSQSSWRHKQS